ncbi:phage tail protein [Rhizobacter sp. SG703]|uniref:phage tail protein n=1 Tax=Rhizobacter sp. SG703 TaxID=2587140 RepID=UPI0014482399|nr:phage tail protein [Rhizobacter sp. SG703]NKI92167.1 phage tail-like protein [Rhizobacter sp. SG703]
MANTGFVVNATRVDPYKNFKFRVLWDGKTVLGVSKVGSLKRTTEVVKHRSGGQNSYDHKSPGRSSYDAVTLERGITHDLEFEKWANAVSSYAGDSAMDLAGYKKDLTLEVLNEKSQVAIRYFLFRCWVSEFTTLPDLDANANATAIEHLKIELEGWVRDVDTPEPSEAG